MKHSRSPEIIKVIETLAVKVEGQQIFPASSEVIWSLLLDPLTLGKIIPGCRAIVPAGSDEYRLTAEVRIGKVMECLEGRLRFERIVPERSFSFIAEASNLDGMVSFRGNVTLEDRGPDTGVLTYAIEMEAAGRPSTITNRMMQTTARSFIRRSFEALQTQIAIHTRVYTTTAAPVSDRNLPYSPENLDHSIVRRRVVVVLATILVTLLIWRRIRGRRTCRGTDA